MPTVLEFQNEHPGTPLLKSPHGITGECVSVPSLFAVENGWPELWGPGDDTAQHIWQNGVTGYEKIINTPTNFPVAGDFVFFSYNHVALVLAANATSITTLEQNDPKGSGVHVKTYNYTGVEGWFHHPSNVQMALKVYPVKSVVNVRTAPHVSAPIVAQLHPGTVEVTGIVPGDPGVVNGHTSSQWGITLNGHYFNMAATQ